MRLVRERAVEAGRAGQATPRLDAQERRPRLRPDAELRHAVPGDLQRQAGAGRLVAQGGAGRPVQDHRVVGEQPLVQRQDAALHRARLRLGAQQAVLHPADRRRLVLREQEPVRPLRHALGQRPAERRMCAERGRQHRVARVAQPVLDREPVAVEPVADLQGEAERIDRAARRVVAQHEAAALRVASEPLEAPVAGEAVLRHAVALPVVAQRIPGKPADDREQHRRVPRPFRPGLPQQLARDGAAQRGELGAVRLDRDSEPGVAEAVDGVGCRHGMGRIGMVRSSRAGPYPGHVKENARIVPLPRGPRGRRS